MFFPKRFYDKGTSPIFCNTAATMLVLQHELSYNPLTTRWYQQGACFSCLFVQLTRFNVQKRCIMIFKSIFSIGCVCFVSYKEQHAPRKMFSVCLKVGRLSSVLAPRVSRCILPNNCMNGGGAGHLLLDKDADKCQILQVCLLFNCNCYNKLFYSSPCSAESISFWMRWQFI